MEDKDTLEQRFAEGIKGMRANGKDDGRTIPLSAAALLPKQEVLLEALMRSYETPTLFCDPSAVKVRSLRFRDERRDE